MPICKTCGVAYLESETHTCDRRPWFVGRAWRTLLGKEGTAGPLYRRKPVVFAWMIALGLCLPLLAMTGELFGPDTILLSLVAFPSGLFAPFRDVSSPKCGRRLARVRMRFSRALLVPGRPVASHGVRAALHPSRRQRHGLLRSALPESLRARCHLARMCRVNAGLSPLRFSLSFLFGYRSARRWRSRRRRRRTVGTRFAR
jgi:hypothetical protein